MSKLGPFSLFCGGCGGECLSSVLLLLNMNRDDATDNRSASRPKPRQILQ